MRISSIACLSLALGLLSSSAAVADDWLFLTPPNGHATQQQLSGPACLLADSASAPGCTTQDYDRWLALMRQERAEQRIRIGYDGYRYGLPTLRWTQSSFIQPQMMAEDRYFYDPVKRRYTVDRYLDDLRSRYGGIDSVLIWPTYPNLGIDDRNQLDFIRSMPGGIAGLRRMVSDFHRRGVRVLFPMMLWDQGTHDPGKPWPEAVAELMAQIGADGVNGDTMTGVPRAFPDAAEHIGHPLVFEPEQTPPDEALAYNLMTWGQYDFPFVPDVDRFKWLEPRHMVNISDRWKRDKTDDLQFAFFNGVGWVSWENVWGIWNGITPRDAEAVRRIAAIERAMAPFLVSEGWQPFFPMLRHGVFASRWPLGGRTLWTIVNRSEYDISGPQMAVKTTPGMRYFDLYHGVELRPERIQGKLVLSFNVEAKGFGAVLAAEAPPGNVSSLMEAMRRTSAKPLSSFSHEWVPLTQRMLPIAPTPAASTAPAGMVLVPGGAFLFKVRGVEIEGANQIGSDVQYPWESSPRSHHQHVMHLMPFWIDEYPVTNRDFDRFVRASHYHPGDDLDFLRDWRGDRYPAGWDDKPVTWVSREDAAAYCKWAGKRLPHEWEWQYAAQGGDGRLYPWGNTWDPARVPVPDTSRSMRGPDDVSAHPQGASPFGVMDMVGNVWQWTDEFEDAHTRSAILRGGSYYRPQGSIWYFPQAYALDEHGRLLLMAPSMDRSGAIGFRCVKDASATH